MKKKIRGGAYFPVLTLILMIFLSPYLCANSFSKKNILKISRENPWSLPKTDRNISFTDTVEVKAVLVEFKQEVAGINENDFSTGDGKFDKSPSAALSMTYKEVIFDPPPHNHDYFSKHLEFLKNYYRQISGGKLEIKPVLYPGVITLDKEIRDYGRVDPRITDRDSIGIIRARGLMRFVHDVLEKGSELHRQGQFIFKKNDVFVIFHAGASGLTSRDVFGIDNFPDDLISTFIAQSDMEYFAEIVNGINVFDSTVRVDELLIIPETGSHRVGSVQSGTTYEFGINGFLVYQFARQLGLPNLFNTKTGETAIGSFDLMDHSGFLNKSGYIPPYPSAWCRTFLGWDKPLEVQPSQVKQNLFLYSADSDSIGPKILKVPINSREYFLIENRNNSERKPVTFFLGNQSFTTTNITIPLGPPYNRDSLFTSTHFESLYLLFYNPEKAPSGVSRVLTDVDNFDCSLPGSGVLIWHIDENVIAQNFFDDLVNADIARRGIDLEEADGFQDIGFQFKDIFGNPAYITGTEQDFYRGDQNGNRQFTPTSNPNSLSNLRANSHLYIAQISAAGEKMSLEIRWDYSREGFPLFVDTLPLNREGLLVLTSPDSLDFFLIQPEAGRIYGWNEKGLSLQSGLKDSIILKDFREQVVDTLIRPTFDTLPLNGKSFVSAGDLDGDGKEECVVAGGSVIRLYLSNHDTVIRISVAGEMSTWPVLVDSSIIVGSSGGWVYRIRQNGGDWKVIDSVQVGSVKVLQMASAKMDSSLERFFYFVLSDKKIVILDSRLNLMKTVSFDDSIRGILLGDLDADGSKEVVITSQQGRISVITKDGEFSKVFPNPLITGLTFSRSAALGDLNADGYLEIVGGSGSTLQVWQYNGTPLSGFPITLKPHFTGEEVQITSAPIIVDLNGDGKMEIIFGTSLGNIEVYNHLGQLYTTQVIQPDQNFYSLFPLSTGGPVSLSPVVFNFQDSLYLGAGSEDGYFYLWNLGKTENRKIHWGQFGHDNQRTFAFSDKLMPVVPGGNSILTYLYNYPNPVYEGETKIRFKLNTPAQVDIRIFDLSGDLVYEKENINIPYTIDTELGWDIRDVVAGIYLCRVGAKQGGQREHKFCKISVVK